MDDIYEFSKNFSLRIDELEEVRGKNPFSPGKGSWGFSPQLQRNTEVSEECLE